MTETLVNFRGVEDFTTHIWPAPDVPEDVWIALREIHQDWIMAQLPVEEWYRASEITHEDDPRKYIESRVDPNILSGKNGWHEQLFREPLVVVNFDGNRPVAAAVTANNTSPHERFPQWLRDLEMRVKMHTLRWKHVHLREAYSVPGILDASSIENHTRVINGLIVACVFHSIDGLRDDRQDLVTYPIRDEADKATKALAEVLSMQQTKGWISRTQEPGYKPGAPKTRMEKPIDQVKAGILALPGSDAILAQVVDPHL